MTQTGIQLPNGPMSASEARRVTNLGQQHHLDLHHWIGRSTGFSNAHIRIDVRGALDARTDAHLVNSLYTQYRDVKSWRIRNEPNLESPNTPDDWKRYLVDLASFVPDNVRLFIPAISPGTNSWLDWVRASSSVANHFSGQDAHVYGSPQEFKTTLAQIRDIYSGSLYITEYNFGAGRQYDLKKYADDWPLIQQICKAYEVEICFVFIWQWMNPDIPLPTLVDVINTPMELAMTGSDLDIGEGFRKVEHLVGPYLESQVYHWYSTDHEISMAVGSRGVALWYKTRNETYALCKDGSIWADYGNYGSGQLVQFR